MILDTRIEFGRNDIDNVLAKMTPNEIDRLPFGAVQLDSAGVVLAYNRTESSLTGREPADVIGRHFFDEIAPCCNTSVFRGTFDAGVEANHLDTIFTYVFDYKMRPTKVKIHMRSALGTPTYWVFVKRL
ncbi:photoactive yellow protein [Acidisphaera sp. L21]|jgi:photoactive yellow protein|uniref:photoactive yellow protein n=1 Tax=Acidisphaera sp. L21 TaxID=1641851 RepID=UPI00131DCCE7|nr:photoactive yellow protein [Acidisphaera sp. L21]